MSNAEMVLADDRSPRKPARKISRTDAGNLRRGTRKRSDSESDLVVRRPFDSFPGLFGSSVYSTSATARFAFRPLLRNFTLTEKVQVNMEDDIEQLSGQSV